MLFKKQTERKFLSVVKNEFSWKCSLHSEVAPSFICVVFSFVWCFIFFGFVFDTGSQSVAQTVPEFVI